ncbi:MAG TPA: hypothetical protein VHT26_17030 [Trebonia sp.]|nr:hypothetical protein [Trebonia sp.]
MQTEWDPAAAEPDVADLLKTARVALRAKTREAESVQANRVTAGRLQLRLGRDLLWCPYARSDGYLKKGKISAGVARQYTGTAGRRSRRRLILEDVGGGLGGEGAVEPQV